MLCDHYVLMDLGLVGLNKGYIIICLHVVTINVQLLKHELIPTDCRSSVSAIQLNESVWHIFRYHMNFSGECTVDPTYYWSKKCLFLLYLY